MVTQMLLPTLLEEGTLRKSGKFCLSAINFNFDPETKLQVRGRAEQEPMNRARSIFAKSGR